MRATAQSGGIGWRVLIDLVRTAGDAGGTVAGEVACFQVEIVHPISECVTGGSYHIWSEVYVRVRRPALILVPYNRITRQSHTVTI